MLDYRNKIYISIDGHSFDDEFMIDTTSAEFFKEYIYKLILDHCENNYDKWPTPDQLNQVDKDLTKVLTALEIAISRRRFYYGSRETRS